MEMGIPRSELEFMDDTEVLRKWVIGIELNERRAKEKAREQGLEGNK